tara:strand:- start:4962 stop:5549 length:588 start_codon:yes stop_codon:yes gene_type:complete
VRNFILLVGILLFINCQYSKRIVNDTSYERTVTIDVATASLGEESKWFSEKTRSEIEEINLLKEEGKNILAQVVARYKNQIGDFKYIDLKEADVIFRVNKVSVQKGRFTFNFLKPGPIYRMKIDADLLIDGKFVSSIKKKIVVNMATVVFPEENVKWMSGEEKRNLENQMDTFEVGLRRLYQNLYFEAFDISLRL